MDFLRKMRDLFNRQKREREKILDKAYIYLARRLFVAAKDKEVAKIFLNVQLEEVFEKWKKKSYPIKEAGFLFFSG